MQRLEVSGAVRPLYGPLGVKGLILVMLYHQTNCVEGKAGWASEYGWTWYQKKSSMSKSGTELWLSTLKVVVLLTEVH